MILWLFFSIDSYTLFVAGIPLTQIGTNIQIFHASQTSLQYILQHVQHSTITHALSLAYTTSFTWASSGTSSLTAAMLITSQFNLALSWVLLLQSQVYYYRDSYFKSLGIPRRQYRQTLCLVKSTTKEMGKNQEVLIESNLVFMWKPLNSLNTRSIFSDI